MAGAFRSRGPWLGVGLFCPVASSLTMASSELLTCSNRLMRSSGWSLPCGCWSEGPCFYLRILRVVPPSVPRRTGRPATIVRPPVLALARMRGARRPRYSHFNRNMWVPLRGCEVRLMLRPDPLLALLRQGRLRSSFHSMSHLKGTSNITTRANRQFPAAGLSPAGLAALQAAPHSGHRSGVARRS
jgi:hypothetical protein